ncbi:hypothetical protein LSTR_LSTR013055 [Laodelphax striatellus]|uniref:Uncharacterized protein n=1 Tax=Laodelphax striatellus TaxID=195883 RepID=A0A482XDY4_LAOST|nr:hypothetical protein LSTR_LSTR013055 [Laodelphax striatellus]
MRQGYAPIWFTFICSGSMMRELFYLFLLTLTFLTVSCYEEAYNEQERQFGERILGYAPGLPGILPGYPAGFPPFSIPGLPDFSHFPYYGFGIPPYSPLGTFLPRPPFYIPPIVI